MPTTFPILNTDLFCGRSSAADAFLYGRFQYLAKNACNARNIVVYSHSKDYGFYGEWVAAHSFFRTDP